jgi:hypothetical protein
VVSTTKTRTLHGYSLRQLSAFDDPIRALIREAHEEALRAAT